MITVSVDEHTEMDDLGEIEADDEDEDEDVDILLVLPFTEYDWLSNRREDEKDVVGDVLAVSVSVAAWTTAFAAAVAAAAIAADWFSRLISDRRFEC